MTDATNALTRVADEIRARPGKSGDDVLVLTLLDLLAARNEMRECLTDLAEGWVGNVQEKARAALGRSDR